MKVLIVGTGLAGCLAAYFESLAGNEVYMTDRAKQFGGLCRSQKIMGIDVHVHGPHVFHTNDPQVWNFVNSITPFEEYFINQGFDVNRSIEETLDLGWSLLSTLPKNELDRVDDEHLKQYYDPAKAKTMFGE